MSRLRPSRRVAALALAVLALAGLSAASASQLAVNGGTLQAGAGSLVDCQPSGQVIAVSLTSAFSSGQYRSTAVRFANVAAACNGLSYRTQLLDAGGSPIDLNGAAAGTDLSGTVTLSGGAFTVAIPSTPAATIAQVVLAVHS
jgi:hypothetical protein